MIGRPATPPRAFGFLHWLWLAGLAGLAAHGLTATAIAIPRAAPGRFSGRMASTDHMLAFLYQPHPAEAIASALRGTAESEAVLFVGRASAPAFAQTFYGLQSAASPRVVVDLRCPESGEARVAADPGAPYGAVVLYEPVRPVVDARAITVGERLAVIPGRPRGLASYCSALAPAASPPTTAP